jgi:uncharacterized phiE125 gp8 family phage protein
MTLFRTIAPEAEPVTLAEAKANLKLDHDGEDELISALIRAAREEVENTTGVAMIDQTWRLAVDELPQTDTLGLRRGPVKEVLSVTLYGADGEASLLDPAGYELDALSSPARLHFASRPSDLRAMNGIEVDFVAGHGEAGTDVPDLLKRAVLTLVAHWYEFRASFGAKDQPVSVPDSYRRLVSAYVPRRLA